MEVTGQLRGSAFLFREKGARLPLVTIQSKSESGGEEIALAPA
jgi:hypothetical protein